MVTMLMMTMRMMAAVMEMVIGDTEVWCDLLTQGRPGDKFAKAGTTKPSYHFQQRPVFLNIS
eukprot:10222401-Karenia_brevis.AAC.1